MKSLHGEAEYFLHALNKRINTLDIPHIAKIHLYEYIIKNLEETKQILANNLPNELLIENSS